MRFYFTGKDYGFPGDSGVVRESSGPFKGTCRQCKNRTVVRLYPYSCVEWLGGAVQGMPPSTTAALKGGSF